MTMHVNVMAPLVIGDPADLQCEKSLSAWERFKDQLKAVKDAGVNAIFFDVWWGIVEPKERQYDWRYYDKLLQTIIDAGLKAVPNISLHRCGGNIGDDVNVPVPAWIWSKLAAKVPSKNPDAVKYVSEQGNASDEFVSVWAVDLVLDDYKALFTAFRDHFADKAQHIVEVTISLGPAGEMRYPSYNSHDRGTGFPTRGALQCYSELARKSWEKYVLDKYTDRDGVKKAWGEFDKIEPPVDCNAFFANRDHIKKQYGKDLFDWYQVSLLTGSTAVIETAIAVFITAEETCYSHIDIGAKVPGVHWHMGHYDGNTLVMGDRLAELGSGVISSRNQKAWNDDRRGRGYRQVVSVFRKLKCKYPCVSIVMHFTCLEKADGEDADMHAESLAHTLVTWVGAEARRQKVTIKGENALGFNLPKPKSWAMMRRCLAVFNSDGAFTGLTLLRIGELTDSKVAMSKLESMVRWINRCTCRAERAAACKKDDGKQAA